jgi:catechol 2,3-dioxygenase-like lactoylglutathione lyase family enzyme
MKPVGIHHVSIMTPDVEATKDFYVDVLGFTVRDDRPDFGIGGCWLNAGGQQVHLVEGATPNRAGQHFALQVDDLDGVIEELRARGFDVRDPFHSGVGRQTTIDDPVGNTVELNQPDR